MDNIEIDKLLFVKDISNIKKIPTYIIYPYKKIYEYIYSNIYLLDRTEINNVMKSFIDYEMDINKGQCTIFKNKYINSTFKESKSDFSLNELVFNIDNTHIYIMDIVYDFKEIKKDVEKICNCLFLNNVIKFYFYNITISALRQMIMFLKYENVYCKINIYNIIVNPFNVIQSCIDRNSLQDMIQIHGNFQSDNFTHYNIDVCILCKNDNIQAQGNINMVSYLYELCNEIFSCPNSSSLYVDDFIKLYRFDEKINSKKIFKNFYYGYVPISIIKHDCIHYFKINNKKKKATFKYKYLVNKNKLFV